MGDYASISTRQVKVMAGFSWMLAWVNIVAMPQFCFVTIHWGKNRRTGTGVLRTSGQP